MIDWGDEEKPRPHGGRMGMDIILKNARRGDLRAVQKHLRDDPTLLTAKSGGHNRTFLWEAVRGNQLAVAKYLLQAGAEVNVPGRIRAEIVVLLKPYCIARRQGKPEMAELLLLAGTQIDMYSACFLGDVERVEQLLEQDSSALTAEQEDDTVWRVTPLHFAVAGGHVELVRRLIDAGALVRPYTRLLSNAAVRMNHPEVLPLLLEAGADPQLVRDWGQRRPGT